MNGEKIFGSNMDLEVFEINYNKSEKLQQSMSDRCIDQVKQSCHTIEAVKLMEHELKTVLSGLVSSLFGGKIEYRWVNFCIRLLLKLKLQFSGRCIFSFYSTLMGIGNSP